MVASELRDSSGTNLNEFQARYSPFYPAKTNELEMLFPIGSLSR